MKDCEVRIVPFKIKSHLSLHPMWFRVQIKHVWIRIGPAKFFRWKTVGEYTTYNCAILDAKYAMKCLNNEWS